MIEINNLTIKHSLSITFAEPSGTIMIPGEILDAVGATSYDIMQHYVTGTNSTPVMQTQFEIDGSTNTYNGTWADADTFMISRIPGREIQTITVTLLDPAQDINNLSAQFFQGPNDFSSYNGTFYYRTEHGSQSVTFTYFSPDGAEDNVVHYLMLQYQNPLTEPLQYTIQVSTSVKDFEYPATTDVTGLLSAAPTLTSGIYIANECHPKYAWADDPNTVYYANDYVDLDAYKIVLPDVTPALQVTIQLTNARWYYGNTVDTILVKDGVTYGRLSYNTDPTNDLASPVTLSGIFYNLEAGTYYLTTGFY